MKQTVILLFFGLLMATGSLCAQDVAAIESTFRKADASMLYPQLSENVEYSFQTDNGNYNKDGFVAVLNKFLRSNPCKTCTVIHQGGRTDSKFVICTVNCSKGNYRVHFFYKKINNQYLITLVRIETTNG